MQYEISDEAAIEFAKEFYRMVSIGSPVDVAVAEARRAMTLALETSVEWATPVIHMRSPDGKLFDLQEQAGVPVLQTIRPRVNFGMRWQGSTPVIQLAVKNVGGGRLEWSFEKRGLLHGQQSPWRTEPSARGRPTRQVRWRPADYQQRR